MSVQKRAQLLYQECFSYLKRAQNLLENVSVFHTLSLRCMWHTATDSSWFWYFTGHFSADGTGSWSGQEHDGGSGGHWADEDVSRGFTERRSSQWKHRSQVSVWLSVCVCDINKQNLLTLACCPAHFEYMSVTRNILWRFVEQEWVFRQRHMLLESWTWKYTYLNTPSLGYLSINMNHNNNHFHFTISGMLKIIHFKKTMSNPCDKEVHFTFTYKNNKSVWTERHVFGHVIYNQMKMDY